MLAADIETYDPNLSTMGVGCVRRDGHIICVGTYDGHNAKAYFPDTREWGELVEKLKSDEPKVFHNGIYDLAWLCVGYDLEVNGTIHDTMTRAVFIDEYKPLGLDDCCKRMGVEGKNKGETIEKWYEEHRKELGFKERNLWTVVDKLMEWAEFREKMVEYNLQDCIATWNLFHAQEPFMAPYADPYKMECDLYPLLLHMKRNGVRIDMNRLASLTDEITQNLQKDEEILRSKWGLEPSFLRSPKKMTDIMHSLDIHSPMLTPKGAEAWNAEALDKINHPITKDIFQYKADSALLTKYLQGSMARCIVNGRIHCDFSPNKRDAAVGQAGGTVTGRFASAAPNLQNISAREYKHGCKTYGSELRELFLPEEGCWLFACDYSQIEYILFMHYAQGPLADQMRAKIREGVDFHNLTMELTGIKVRAAVKTINYGKLYGMGLQTMLNGWNYPTWKEEGEKLGMTPEQYCKHCNDIYDERLAVIPQTVQLIQREAKLYGYVTSIGGRRHHKPPLKYNPKTKRWDDGMYKMTNYKIQGGGAELLKKGLQLAWRAGVFNEIKMHLTVHDENVCSVPDTRAGVEAAAYLEECMDMAYSDILSVPIRAEGGLGENWSAKHAESAWQEARQKYGLETSSDMQKRLWRVHHDTEINMHHEEAKGN